MDCPATQGCRIAKTLDSESPQWVRSRLLASTAPFLTSQVRDCSLEEEIGCEESTGADGSVSVQGKTQSPRRPFNSYYFSHRQSWLASCNCQDFNSYYFSTQTVLACICKTELCNENWVAAGSSTTNQGGVTFSRVTGHAFKWNYKCAPAVK